MELREAHRHHKRTDAALVEVGNIVVIHSDNQPRGFWKLAKVEKTITGQDGKMRAAAVRDVNSQDQPTMLYRPIQYLFLLEISSQEKVDSQPTIPDLGDNSGDLDRAAV